MTHKRRWLPLLALLLVALVFTAYRLTRHDTPASQPPLAYLTGTLTHLREDFNQYADHTRIIVLLSPT